MQFAVEEALDELYAAKPEDFTALRTKLAAAAKKSGDAEAARAAAGTLRCARPNWWVRSGVLNSAAAVEYPGGNQA